MDKIEQAREVSSRIWNAGYVDESATIDALIAELAALKAQDPIATLYIDSYGKVKLGQTMPPEEGSFSVYLAAGAQTYSDSTAELSVGDSSFESWYASYVKEGTKGLKHHCRDAYAAGMGDPLVVAAGAQPAPEQEVHDALCPALTGGKCDCTESPVTVDKAWSQFCGGIGRGPDAPYPGMIEAFENHYGQSFTDKDWRSETGIWAAAWSAASAKLAAQAGAQEQAQPVQQEPAAWEHCFVDPSKKILSYTKTCAGFPPRDDAYQINPLYAQPVQAQERKEQP